MDAELLWQERQLIVTACTTDEAALSGYEWPENGYLVSVRYSTKDNEVIPIDLIEAYMHEIVLSDGDGQEYGYRRKDPDQLGLIWSLEKSGAQGNRDPDLYNTNASVACRAQDGRRSVSRSLSAQFNAFSIAFK